MNVCGSRDQGALFPYNDSRTILSLLDIPLIWHEFFAQFSHRGTLLACQHLPPREFPLTNKSVAMRGKETHFLYQTEKRFSNFSRLLQFTVCIGGIGQLHQTRGAREQWAGVDHKLILLKLWMQNLFSQKLCNGVSFIMGGMQRGPTYGMHNCSNSSGNAQK